MGVKQPVSPCAGCVDWDAASYCCMYRLHYEQVRPCPGGKGCTIKSRKARKETDMANMIKWDTARAEALFLEGRPAEQIAEETGASVNSIKTYLRKRGLRRSKNRETGGEAGASTPPPADDGEKAMNGGCAITRPQAERPDPDVPAEALEPGMRSAVLEELVLHAGDVARETALPELLRRTVEEYTETRVYSSVTGAPVRGLRVTLDYDVDGNMVDAEVELL
ncbi:MAG: sigma-70 region 4 domain-containing protein [Oscillospiraceae bacterium]|nr:sigma-70 region 4 domain-containing protein [Oscillospiraceae bacterium]